MAARFAIFLQLANVAHSFISRPLFERNISTLPLTAARLLCTRDQLRQRSHSPGLQETRLYQSTLSQQIADAYRKRQTDGIIELGVHRDGTRYEAADLWEAVVEASNSKPGVAASIVNALIASSPSVDLALALYDLSCCQSDAPFQIRPDLITFCLLADLSYEHDELEAADDFLDLARRFSEKNVPGNRKERAAARRRKRVSSLREAESTLRDMLGPEFAVLFENEAFAVVNKPSGISCTAQPGKKQTVDLPKALIQTINPISSINRALVHRLDKDTSGCLIIPKTDVSHAMFARKFFLRSVSKTYKCIVTSWPENDSGSINIPVDSRPAESSYTVMAQFEDGKAMLELATQTGRKHQVRVHCAQGLSCPILGDVIYGPESSANVPLHLHASSVSFNDANHQKIVVEAPLPKFWPNVDS